MPFDAGFDEKSVVIEEGLPFRDRVLRYHQVYQDLLDAYERVEDEVLAADASKSLERYKAADAEHDRISALLLPFVSGHQEAKRLKEKGLKLSNWEGKLTPEPSPDDAEGGVVDAIVGIFLIYLRAAAEEILRDIAKQSEELAEDGTLTDAITILSGGVLLQVLADKWFKSNDNSELARFMRDPVRRPEQILRNWRDKLLDGDSKNIFSTTVGRPARDIVRTGKKIDKEWRRIRKNLKF